LLGEQENNREKKKKKTGSAFRSSLRSTLKREGRIKKIHLALWKKGRMKEKKKGKKKGGTDQIMHSEVG